MLLSPRLRKIDTAYKTMASITENIINKKVKSVQSISLKTQINNKLSVYSETD